MLAKIGHAYAVSQLGLAGFAPCLPDFVFGRPSRLTPPPGPGDLISGTEAAEPPGTSRHEISLRLEPNTLAYPREYAEKKTIITVRIRLFSDLGVPAHYVLAGWLC